MSELEQELQNKIAELQARVFKSEVRLEALLRWMFAKQSLTMEEYQGAIVSFQSLNTAVAAIHNISSIMDKVNAAADYNKTAVFKIQGDDLGLKKIIENSGGTSDFTARLVLAKLPCSESFSDFMKQFIDPTKNVSENVLLPDQVINPQ